MCVSQSLKTTDQITTRMGRYQKKFREVFSLRGEALIIVGIHTESPWQHQIYQIFNIIPQMKSHLKRRGWEGGYFETCRKVSVIMSEYFDPKVAMHHTINILLSSLFNHFTALRSSLRNNTRSKLTFTRISLVYSNMRVGLIGNLNVQTIYFKCKHYLNKYSCVMLITCLLL